MSNHSAVLAGKHARELDQPAFVSVQPEEVLAAAEEVAAGLPLGGMPFAVKDNIDVAGLPTTAADPRRTDPATAHAHVVGRLVDAGAVPVGKTNLDQYATGLVGTRSPYGACHSVLAPDHVSGGSSSGSAVAVAAGVVPFALGTDTAGSGRVPAAFNGLVGWKPTRGLLSTRGVVPACASLDCVTTLTRDVATAQLLRPVLSGFDAEDPWSRPGRVPADVARQMSVVGVPAGDLDLDPGHAEAWRAAVSRAGSLFRVVQVDVEPFLEAARLLYEGPWVAERYAAFGDALREESTAVDPTVRGIVLAGATVTGPDTFRGLERLEVLRRQARSAMAGVDALMLPVTPGHPTLAAVAADPVGVNSRLGTFTNMVNLLDLCAVAVPAGERPDGLPFGVQLLAPAFADEPLLDLAAAWESGSPVIAEPSPARASLAVVGAHLSGMPLNHQLVSAGGRLLRRARTAAYRMFELPAGDGLPARPALVPGGGACLEAEVWELPSAGLGEVLTSVRAPLALGDVWLEDGSTVTGFVMAGPEDALGDEITEYGGWRACRASS